MCLEIKFCNFEPFFSIHLFDKLAGDFFFLFYGLSCIVYQSIRLINDQNLSTLENVLIVNFFIVETFNSLFFHGFEILFIGIQFS